MKTIIENATDLSHSIYEDSLQVVIGENSTTLTIFTGDDSEDNIETNTIIDEIDSSNYFLVEDVTPPEDWKSNKYLYADSEWLLNPDWVEPEDPEV